MKFEREPGYTGKLTEEEVLGGTKQESETGKENENFFHSFDELVELVKDQQPFKDPSAPTEKRFPDDLLVTIAEKLGLDNFGNGQLKFFTAVGSRLDKEKGVDAFFELDLGGGDRAIVTLDVTNNPRKGNYKANVCFEWPPQGISPKEDKEEWNKKRETVSDSVVDAMLNRAFEKGRVIKSLSEYELTESKKISEEKRKRILLKLGHAA